VKKPGPDFRSGHRLSAWTKTVAYRRQSVIGQASVRPEIYSWAIGNEQGLVFDVQSGTALRTEHGPRGGDELNVIVAHRNTAGR